LRPQIGMDVARSIDTAAWPLGASADPTASLHKREVSWTQVERIAILTRP
jgi:hypothetical protein